MRKFLAFVSILALSALAFASFAVPTAQAQESEPTIVEIAASNEDFSTLVAAVQAAGLADTLAGEGDFTVFAPTNDAFDALFASLGIAPEDLLADKPLLTEVLLYHVALGELTSEEVAYLGELRMANGDLSTISVRDGSPYINDARIILEEWGVEGAAALRASEGWGGDGYVVLEDAEGHTAFAWMTQWDTVRDAKEFAEAIGKVAGLQVSLKDDRVGVVRGGPSEQGK